MPLPQWTLPPMARFHVIAMAAGGLQDLQDYIRPNQGPWALTYSSKRRIVVTDMKTLQTLLSTKLLECNGRNTPGVLKFEQAERVCERLNRMRYTMLMIDLGDNPVAETQQLFDQLWKEEEL